IRKANPAQGLSTHAGDVILIPNELLAPGFGGEKKVIRLSGDRVVKEATRQPDNPTTRQPSREGADVQKAAEVRKSEDDPVERTSADANVADVAAEIPAAGLPSLSYE